MGSSEDLRLLRYRLVEVLVELAASPEEQIAYFDRTDSDVDDLVNDFSWTRGWTPRIRAANLLPESTAGSLDGIDHLFTEMHERHDVSLWTDDSLANLDEWRRIRAFARTALRQLYDFGIPIPSIADPLLKPLDGAVTSRGVVFDDDHVNLVLMF